MLLSEPRIEVTVAHGPNVVGPLQKWHKWMPFSGGPLVPTESTAQASAPCHIITHLGAGKTVWVPLKCIYYFLDQKKCIYYLDEEKIKKKS